MERILVVGASGTVGSELGKILRQQGHAVRTTTSKPPKGADQVQLDLVTGRGIREAFEGIDRAFLLSPSGFGDQHAVLAPLIAEARRRGLKKVVLMTALGADANEAAPLRRAERELEQSGVPYAIIRPNWFMQNFQTFWIQGILNAGKILLPARDAKVSFIDARDISAVAAKLLTEDREHDRAFNLTGPQSLSHSEVAALITRASGRTVSYEEITPAQFRSGLLGAGLPADYTDFLVLIMGFLAEGYNAAPTGEVKAILGREPGSFADYAARERRAWA